MKKTHLFFLLFSLCFLSLPAQNLYVLAPSGLNLRETGSPGSTKLTKVPYGGKVKLIEESYTGDLLVDNIPGGMAQVSYKGQTGYIFDGYLSKFSAPSPQPKDEENLNNYADQLRNEEKNVLVETINRDWGGYFQSEYAIEIPTSNLLEGYIVARQLFEIPKEMHLPKPSKQDAEQQNPNKAEHVWMESITVTRDKNTGAITEITYYKRQEGGGRSVSVQASPSEENQCRISLLYIAD